MVMTSTSASVEENLVTFIVKNLLSKDAIVTFVADTELYLANVQKWVPYSQRYLVLGLVGLVGFVGLELPLL